ncbi:MAG: ATP-dependent helicase [Desertimonas sp.]
MADAGDADSRLLAGLDPDQRRAVTTPSTLVAVIARAGSGKTRVLTRRIAHRVRAGSAEARHTMALTFTREAAGELRRRLRQHGLRDAVETGTFHAHALGLLRQRWHDLDRPAPSILNDRGRFLGEIADGVPLTTLANEADWAAARGVRADRYERAASEHRRRGPTPSAAIAAALGRYETLKHRRGVIDLDDLLRLLVDELASDERYAEQVRYRFRHLLVDEAQDLNPTQFRLLQLLDGARGDLFLVGDPAQAIYGFNGADPELLTHVDTHLPGIEIHRLPVNHRCTMPIVDIAEHTLATAGLPTGAVSGRGDGPAVVTAQATDADDEARVVATAVRGLDPGLLRHGQVAVLARTNAQLPTLRQALLMAGVPVRQPAIPPGGPLATAVRAATAQPSASRLRGWAHDVLETDRPAEGPRVAPDDSIAAAERRTAAAVLEFLREQPLGDGAALRAWIATANPFAVGADRDGVHLLTFHAAKGREWHTVVVTGVETSLVPFRSATTTAAKAEEARLLHVALTRASDELIITHAARRGGYARKLSPLLTGWSPAVPTAVAVPFEIAARERRADPTEARLAALRHWREGLARAANVVPDVICDERTLTEIARHDPADADALAAATGMGPLTADRLFPALRAHLDGASASG